MDYTQRKNIRAIQFHWRRAWPWLGGIAKGYIADELAQFMRSRGVKSALLDLGGNIYALGSNQGEPFKIGVACPDSPQEVAGYLELRDTSAGNFGHISEIFLLGGTEISSYSFAGYGPARG